MCCFIRLVLLVCCITVAAEVSASKADTLTQTLRGVNVSGHRVRSYLRDIEGKSVISMEMMQQMPRILGNADPMHYAQLLPGVQTNSEYDAGLHIQGCDNAHNQVGIDGVPLYNVAHMLGFFSIFNATHFSAMQLSKSAKTADAPNRLGGTVYMQHSDSIVNRVSGDVSVGPMSSQGTLRIPINSRSSLTVSARAAYLNLLYSQWLKIDESEMRYSFSDYNITYLYRPDYNNTIWIDAYYGNDDVSYNDVGYEMNTSLKWSNLMGAIHWRHNIDKGLLEQCAYYTYYRNRFGLDQTNVSVKLPSSICDVGYKAKLEYGRMSVGADIAYHSIQPQNPQVSGLLQQSGGNEPRQYALEASLYADYSQPIAERIVAVAGLRYNIYSHSGSTFFSLDPSLSVCCTASRNSKFTLSTGIKHQYLFNAGFSNVGLPTEFWFSSSSVHRPQYSYNASLEYETYLFDKAYRLTAEIYYKRLFHQIEYNGNVLDFIYSDYDIDNVLLHGNGYNYGLNMMLEKRKGRLTGWMSYSLGRAMRRYPGTKYDGIYPANHERIHEFNLVATYRLSARWSFGTTLVVASGTPYTAAEKFYMVNNNVITQFGSHNGKRLNPYKRLDLSVNYDFKTSDGHKSGINLSLYNVTMQSNDLFCRLKIYKGQFANRPFRFIVNILPSINYYYSF